MVSMDEIIAMYEERYHDEDVAFLERHYEIMDLIERSRNKA